MSEEMIHDFQRRVIEGTDSYSDFVKSYESEIPLEFHRWIVNNLDHTIHKKIVQAAFYHLAKNRDVSVLDLLVTLHDEWKNTYYNEYEYLVALLRNAAVGAKCNCNVYSDGQFNAPPYQDDLEILGNERRVHGDFLEVDVLHVQCKICEAEWEVEVDYHYHYPHSHWRKYTG